MVWGGGKDAITMSPKMIETLVKFDADVTQIKKPSNETKFKKVLNEEELILAKKCFS